MTTVHIEDSTPEGRFLLDLIRNHKSVTIEPKKSEEMCIRDSPEIVLLHIF